MEKLNFILSFSLINLRSFIALHWCTRESSLQTQKSKKILKFFKFIECGMRLRLPHAAQKQYKFVYLPLLLWLPHAAEVWTRLKRPLCNSSIQLFQNSSLKNQLQNTQTSPEHVLACTKHSRSLLIFFCKIKLILASAWLFESASIITLCNRLACGLKMKNAYGVIFYQIKIASLDN